MLDNSAAHQLLTAACNWVYRQADWVTVLSPGFKQALAARRSPIPIEVIYNWCDETAQPPAPRDETLAQLGLAGRFNVLFAGTMGVMQGLDTVLDAALFCAKRIPAVQFVLMGGGVDFPRLKSKAAAMGLANVPLLPRQPPEAMGRFYALADALLV